MTQLDPESRRILAQARVARTPSSADKERVGKRLALALGVSAGAAAVAQSAAASGGARAGLGWATLKWWVTGGAVVVAAAGGYLGLPPHAAPKASSPVPAAPARAPVAGSELASPAPPEPVAMPAAPAAPTPPLGPTALHGKPRASVAGGASLARELELLHAAQTEWRAGRSSRALALVHTHRRRFPRSELRLERDALQVLALCELGRRSEASRLAQALFDRAPRMPLRGAIEQACGL